MDKILEIIKQAIGAGAVKAICLVAKAVNAVVGFLDRKDREKTENQKKEDAARAEKKLDDACDSGDVKDLLDAAAEYGRKTALPLLMAIATCLAGGCMSQTIEITAASDWEGRYGSAENARKALAGAELGKGESIWILSNTTLKTLLKSTGNKK